MRTVDLKKFREKKKSSEDAEVFRRNYEALDPWEKEMWDLYIKADEAMSALFRHINESWRCSNDHMPQKVWFIMEKIFEKLKGR